MLARPLDLGVLTRRDDLPDWLSRLNGGKLAVDTEHTGFNWWAGDRVGGISFAAGTTAVYCCRDALGPAAEWLGDQIRAKRPLVFHSGKGDLHQLRATFGLHVPYPVDDVLIESFLLDNRGVHYEQRAGKGSHALKDLAQVYVDPRAHEAERRLDEARKAAGGRTKADLLLAPVNVVGFYAALDAWYTLQLDHQFIPCLRAWQQPPGRYPSLWSLYENERWLLLALRDMEERGIRVNVDFLERWTRKFARKIQRIEKELERVAGKRIEWDSTPQLRELIYGKLRQKPTRFTQKTREPSTDEVALLRLKHPIGALLLQYRDATKQHRAYGVGLLERVGPDSKIHAQFRQNGAETGRLSCADPNMQQMTRESGVRSAFIPEYRLAFRFADLSQVEMRFAAHAADDPTLVNGFRNDPDFDTHRATAQKMFGVREPTPRQRKYGKIMNFTMLFGGGLDKVTEQLIALITVPEAINALKELGHRPSAAESPHRSLGTILRKLYFKEFPSIRGASRREQELAEQRTFVMNDFGRHRYLEGEKWYRAFNTRIQGNAAEQAKTGLVAIYRELQLRDRALALILQIHDEAIYLSDGDPRTDRRVLELLKDETTFRVPILADMNGSTTTWQDKQKIEL